MPVHIYVQRTCTPQRFLITLASVLCCLVRDVSVAPQRNALLHKLFFSILMFEDVTSRSSLFLPARTQILRLNHASTNTNWKVQFGKHQKQNEIGKYKSQNTKRLINKFGNYNPEYTSRKTQIEHILIGRYQTEIYISKQYISEKFNSEIQFG